jgi:hypothetical protein
MATTCGEQMIRALRRPRTLSGIRRLEGCLGLEGRMASGKVPLAERATEPAFWGTFHS